MSTFRLYRLLGNKALNCLKETLGENHPDYALQLGRLSSFYYFISDYSKALQYKKEQIDINYINILHQFNSLTNNQRAAYWSKTFQNYTDEYPSTIFKAESFTVSGLYNKSALFSKGLLLNTEAEINRLIEKSGDENALQMFEELRILRLQIYKQYERPITERYMNVDSLKTVADQLEKKLIE